MHDTQMPSGQTIIRCAIRTANRWYHCSGYPNRRFSNSWSGFPSLRNGPLAARDRFGSRARNACARDASLRSACSERY